MLKAFWQKFWSEQEASERPKLAAGCGLLFSILAAILLLILALLLCLLHPQKNGFELVLFGVFACPLMLATLLRKTRLRRVLAHLRPFVTKSNAIKYNPLFLPLGLIVLVFGIPWGWLMFEAVGGRDKHDPKEWAKESAAAIVFIASIPLLCAAYAFVRWGHLGWGIAFAASLAHMAFGGAITGIKQEDGVVNFFGRMRVNASPQFTLGLIAIFAAAFGCIHFAVWSHDHRQYSNMAGWFDALYFSVITLATVGYGDIAPVGHLARVLTLVEVASGVVMLVFVVNAAMTAWMQGQGDLPKQKS